MSIDLYTREPGNKKFQDDILEVTDEITLLIIQIENLFLTTRKKVMGSNQMGLNLEDILFTLNLTEAEIKLKVSDQVFNYCPLAIEHDVEVDVNFFGNVDREVAVIDIFINNSKTLTVLL